MLYCIFFLSKTIKFTCERTPTTCTYVFTDYCWIKTWKDAETANTYHSGRVTSVSMTVPGGGLDSFPPMRLKNLLLMRFFTTTTLTLGLWWADGEVPLKTRILQYNLGFVPSSFGEGASTLRNHYENTCKPDSVDQLLTLQRTWGHKVQLFQRVYKDENSLIVVPHGLDGVHDLCDLIVDHAVQLTVSHSISVHNDTRGQAVVVLQIIFQCSWKTQKVTITFSKAEIVYRDLSCILKFKKIVKLRKATCHSRPSSVRPWFPVLCAAVHTLRTTLTKKWEI